MRTLRRPVTRTEWVPLSYTVIFWFLPLVDGASLSRYRMEALLVPCAALCTRLPGVVQVAIVGVVAVLAVGLTTLFTRDLLIGAVTRPCVGANVRRHACDPGPPQIMTVVLIHGGGATGAFWDRLVPFLDVHVPPLVVDLPGRRGRPADLDHLTVDEEMASVVADIEASAPAGPVTLVAHSSGGLVVPGVVAALHGRVQAIVLNAALVPAEGECGIECMQERHREGLRQAVAAAAAEKDGRAIILPAPADPEALRRSYGGDPLDDATLAFVTDPERSVADTVHHYFQPVHWSAAAGIPITYVLNERDRPIRPDMQEVMVRRLPPPVEVIRLDSGHLLPVTSPAVFAEIVNRVAA